MKDELVKDLEGIEELSEVYYDGAGMKLDCDACTFSEGSRCSPLGTCKEGILRFIATRLTELGYVKVVRCGECKWWVRCECPECRKSKSPIMACGNPDIIDVSVRGKFDYCSAGVSAANTNVSSGEEQMCKAKEGTHDAV